MHVSCRVFKYGTAGRVANDNLEAAASLVNDYPVQAIELCYLACERILKQYLYLKNKSLFPSSLARSGRVNSLFGMTGIEGEKEERLCDQITLEYNAVAVDPDRFEYIDTQKVVYLVSDVANFICRVENEMKKFSEYGEIVEG